MPTRSNAESEQLIKFLAELKIYLDYVKPLEIKFNCIIEQYL